MDVLDDVRLTSRDSDHDEASSTAHRNGAMAGIRERLSPTREDALHDYHLAYTSRQVSLIGRREVLSGNAKFGIFGDGKEVAQIVLAKVFQPGDFRSGYYRDQTLMFALGITTPAEFFAQLYAHTNVEAEPASGGRLMNAHFVSRLIDDQGRWRPQVDSYNTAADVSPTAGHMPRLVGLAHASRMYREASELQQFPQFSRNGNEIAFGTIGNASCAEGLFWETLNAIGVLRAPALISIWDDGYGISVPNELQITKGDLSALLQGFRYDPVSGKGFDLYTVPGWDYLALIDVYQRAAARTRAEHIPALVHVTEMTQPQGHSTSGSHERYKTAERLAWEAAHDPLPLLREWIIAKQHASAAELDDLERGIRQQVEAVREQTWRSQQAPISAVVRQAASLLEELARESTHEADVDRIAHQLRGAPKPTRKLALEAASAALVQTHGEAGAARTAVAAWRTAQISGQREQYAAHLTSADARSALRVPVVAPQYGSSPTLVRGFEVLQANFDACLSRDPRVCIFGEDVGRLGDVNQGLAGLQAKYGALRVADTGIREATIIGQAIGLALRGLRPIAEIQYLDYVLYALMTLSDDLATLHWRTCGGQKAPVIVRTRGHRLEGVWHAGSPMGALLHLLRGMHVLVPRDMTRAAGFYNTLLQADDPALVVEVLNGYRLREPLPDNSGAYTLPLGVPEVLRLGDDVTLVTYGACCRIALHAAQTLEQLDISVEVIDVQSLLPFDTNHRIVESLKKTSRVVFLDEDVPGGATAFMLQQVLEVQHGYAELDSAPRTITAQPHRPAYGTDGDYFSKPNAEDIVGAIYEMLHEAAPAHYPALF